MTEKLFTKLHFWNRFEFNQEDVCSSSGVTSIDSSERDLLTDSPFAASIFSMFLKGMEAKRHYLK